MKAHLLFPLLIFFGKNLSAETQYVSQYIQLNINGQPNYYCIDYCINDERYPYFEVLDLVYEKDAKVLPLKAQELLQKIFELNSRLFVNKDTVSLSDNIEGYSFAEAGDLNADGIGDVSFYNVEASGKNAIYHAFINLNGKLVHWQSYPTPVWGIDLKTRTITGGWNGGGGWYASCTYQITGDTDLLLLHNWTTTPVGNGQLVRKDSIFEKGQWRVNIDSNFVFDH